MICVLCKHGETSPGAVTVTVQRGPCTVVFKDVPADVCENCGEYYLSEGTATALFEMAEAAVRRGAEVEIVRFAA